jgi:hypothetical protein
VCSETTGNLRLHVQSSVLRVAVLEERDDVDDGDKPLSREEMTVRAAQQLSRHINEVSVEGVLPVPGVEASLLCCCCCCCCCCGGCCGD